jgi:hypothetical protein
MHIMRRGSARYGRLDSASLRTHDCKFESMKATLLAMDYAMLNPFTESAVVGK